MGENVKRKTNITSEKANAFYRNANIKNKKYKNFGQDLLIFLFLPLFFLRHIQQIEIKMYTMIIPTIYL